MKKLFKNILMQFVFALSVFSIVGCQEYEMDSQPEQPINMQVDAKEAYTMLATSPSNIAFGISSNTPWSISVDQQWCTVTPTSSAVSSLVSEVVISAESNETANERIATITITGEGVDSKVITLTQESKENLVVVKPSDVVPTDGGDVVFHIVSNKAWEVTTTDEFLNVMDKTKGEGDESGDQIPVTITVPANAGALRTGHITVKTALEEVNFEVTQDGVVIVMEEPTESGTIDFAGGADEQIIRIRANRPWQVKNDSDAPDWVAAEKINDNELKITTTASNKLSTRKYDVILETVDFIPGFEGIPFTVTQSPNYWFDAAPDKLIVDEATGDVKIMQQGKNAVNSNFAFKKGSFVVDIAGMEFDAESGVNFNFWPNAGDTNFHLDLLANKEGNFTCGGHGYNWEQANFTYSVEEIKAIRKIEFIVEDDPDHEGMLRIRLLIDNVEKANLKNKENVYAPGAANPCNGQNIFVKLYPGNENNYITIKSMTYTPVE